MVNGKRKQGIQQEISSQLSQAENICIDHSLYFSLLLSHSLCLSLSPSWQHLFISFLSRFPSARPLSRKHTRCTTLLKLRANLIECLFISRELSKVSLRHTPSSTHYLDRVLQFVVASEFPGPFTLRQEMDTDVSVSV